MPILSDADMGPFRTLFASLACDKECTIKRPVLADDGYGHKTQPLSTIAVVLALIKKPGATEGASLGLFAGQIASKTVTQIDFPYGQDIREGDQLFFTGNSKVLIVHKILDPGSFSISTTVLASEMS